MRGWWGPVVKYEGVEDPTTRHSLLMSVYNKRGMERNEKRNRKTKKWGTQKKQNETTIKDKDPILTVTDEY